MKRSKSKVFAREWSARLEPGYCVRDGWDIYWMSSDGTRVVDKVCCLSETRAKWLEEDLKPYEKRV